MVNLRKALTGTWIVAIVFLFSVFIFFSYSGAGAISFLHGKTVLTLLLLSSLAFVAEYVDSSLGMGYGTTLTPILMFSGYTPLQIVPAVLFSEFVTGISAGLAHHSLGNVDLSRGTDDRRVMYLLLALSVVGTLAAVVMALNLPARAVKFYIGVIITAVGLFLIAGIGRKIRYSSARIIALGTVAAFNKGISGGGYGPLITGGQIMCGVPEKNAVGITSFVEGVVCLVGLILYVTMQGGIYWPLAGALTAGAVLSVPVAAWTVKIVSGPTLRWVIGVITLLLGVMTLVKLF
ncbi:sulfite exporter TauE/SafE family protein [bacterium]|nr:sulfite exporter TauE/SafE family protein [bacterium]